MDSEFTRLLTRVILLGGAIGVIGAAVLFFAFRAFGLRGRDFRANVLVAVLLLFVLLCCALLIRLSLLK